MHLQSSGQPENNAMALFSPSSITFPNLHHIPHPPSHSPVIPANATVVAFVLLQMSMFNFHCYSRVYQRLLRNWLGSGSCNLLWLLAQKITKGIHSCKPVWQHFTTNCPNFQQTRELNQHLNNITQTQQQRPESLTATLTPMSKCQAHGR